MIHWGRGPWGFPQLQSALGIHLWPRPQIFSLVPHCGLLFEIGAGVVCDGDVGIGNQKVNPPLWAKLPHTNSGLVGASSQPKGGEH